MYFDTAPFSVGQFVAVPASKYFPEANQEDVLMVPEGWSNEAVRLLVTKYFRKMGVPKETVAVPEDGIPEFLWRRIPVEGTSFGCESGARDVFHRIAGCWAYWASKLGMFADEASVLAFYHYMFSTIATQRGAPNSPQWFNTGLYWAYGIDAPATGHWYCEEETGQPVLSTSAYQRPQPSACFILSVSDDLVREGGIMDLVRREASLFKFGSGAGTNFSALRGLNEPLSGGGTSSGLMGWLKIFDRSAAAIQSGGTTRRAAKMVILDDDHPEVQEFVLWKSREEYKVADLVTGSIVLERVLSEVHHAAWQMATNGDTCADSLRYVVAQAEDIGAPKGIVQHAVGLGLQHHPWHGVERMTTDWQSEAYLTVSGQQSNNSVRLSDRFMETAAAGGEWSLISRVSKQVMRQVSAKDLLHDIAWANWTCGDPGVQFSDTIEAWNPVKADGKIRATNPCAEYIHLDDTACNLASVNLLKFFDPETGNFDVKGFIDAVRAWTVASDISVSMAQYPSREIAIGSWKYRSLGLGYANMATVLTWMGLPYDSEEARCVAAWITSLMTAYAWITSSEMAAKLGTFPRYQDNIESMLEVMGFHAGASKEFEEKIEDDFPDLLSDHFDFIPEDVWELVKTCVLHTGMRNSHMTCIAPTGTIGLVMDADTTGLEPDFALVKVKEYAGGGKHLFVSQALGLVLRARAFSEKQVEEIICHVKGTRRLPPWASELLTDDELRLAREMLPSALSIHDVFGPETLKKISVPIGVLSGRLLGVGTLDGAPYVGPEDVAVFKTAKDISWVDHMDMISRVQPFLSGGISKTINLPSDIKIEEIESAIFRAWHRGVKALTFYRDGSKLTQPLASFDVVVPTLEPVEPAGTYTQVTPVEIKSDPVNTAYMEAEEWGPSPPYKKVEPVKPKVVVRYLSRRRRLPNLRRGYTQKVVIDGNKVFLHTGEYEDGTLGEIFIDMHKQGATLSGLMGAFAVSISLGLQHGVPLEKFVDLFSHQVFEPNGMVQGDERIQMCQSLIDYIFRHLAVRYLGREDMAHVEAGDIRLSPPDEPWEEEETAERALDKVGSSSVQPPPSYYLKNDENVRNLVLPLVSPDEGLRSKLGYTGDICQNPECRKATMVTSGNCKKCVSCGMTTGCS